ncbi:MAG: hypothetical protein JO147_06600, partial [Actinobacteria bacterium]|nr:hypothetical protein [Actinomycetota bacterium]
MSRPWSGSARFRPGLGDRPRTSLSRPQAAALLAVLAAVVTAVALASVLVKPSHSRAFDLVHGTVFLQDNGGSPLGVNLANGKATVRLKDAYTLVNAPEDVTASEAKPLIGVRVVPLENGTLLLNQNSGQFNIVDSSGFAIKTKGGGVPLST